MKIIPNYDSSAAEKLFEITCFEKEENNPLGIRLVR